MEQHGLPPHPEQLLFHSWIVLARDGGSLIVDLRGPEGSTCSLCVEPRIASNNQLLIQQMCEAGLGLTLMGSTDVHADVEADRLVRPLLDRSLGSTSGPLHPSATPNPPRCARPSRRWRASSQRGCGTAFRPRSNRFGFKRSYRLKHAA